MARGKGKNKKRTSEVSSAGENPAPNPPPLLSHNSQQRQLRLLRKAKRMAARKAKEAEEAAEETTLNTAADFVDLSNDTPVNDCIDLSNETDTDEEPMHESSKQAAERATDAKSKSPEPESSKQAAERETDAKSKSPELSFEIDTEPVPVPPEYQPSNFTPMKSILSSMQHEDENSAEEAEDGEVVEMGVKDLQIGRGRNRKPILIDIDVQPHPDTEAKLDGAKKEEQEKTEVEAELEAGDKSGLLLPEHVRLMESDEEGEPIEGSFIGGTDGVHVVDDGAKGTSRYFNELDEDEAAFLAAADQRQVCRRCKKTGHKEAQCPHIICTTCGAMDEHDRRDCPWSVVCFGCGERGHRKIDCPDPALRNAPIRGCHRCGLRDHMDNTCPLIWRVYVYRSPSERDQSLEERDAAEGWVKEAVGGNPETKWCYNCAMDGHLGDNCGMRRGNLARRVLNSAFSEIIANRGPFSYATQRQGKHHRFDDELPDESSYSRFAGANPGRKGKEKAQQRHRYADRRGRSGTDSDDWFSRDRRRDRSRSPDRGPRRPWSERRDRDRDRGGDRGGGGFKFGSMSLPGSPSPHHDSRRGKEGGLLQQALHNGRNRRRERSPRWDSDSYMNAGLSIKGRGADRERDMEREWRQSGAGGGNVADWGDDYDQLMRERREGRDRRDERPRYGPSRGSGGGGGGRGGKGGGGGGGGSRGGGGGQRYRGSY